MLLDEPTAGLDLDWQECVKFDSRYLRPTEVNLLQGDASKARDLLGWKPRVSWLDLVKMMVDADMRLAEKERTLVNAGHLV